MLVLALRGYQRIISPVLSAVGRPLGLGCRFLPTCSEYALGAVRQHGAWRGTGLAARRLCRCHPWGGCGYDPVPGPETPCVSSPLNDWAEGCPSRFTPEPVRGAWPGQNR